MTKICVTLLLHHNSNNNNDTTRFLYLLGRQNIILFKIIKD